MEIKREEVQTALKVLLTIHEDKEMLEKFKEINGLHLAQNAQSSVAQCFRFLTELRSNEKGSFQQG